jgi:hypothetical protein
MRYLKKYKMFESLNIISKSEFPKKEDIVDYFYDFSDTVGDYINVEIQQSGYVFFPASDINKAVE